MNFLEGFRRRQRQQDLLAEELAAHLEELTEELVDAGCNPQEARQEARRRFGNQTALLEGSREVWRFKWLDALVRDVSFGWRLARRQPWTMLAAVASIAVGVGANTAVTSVLNAVLLNPLGIRNADRIVAASVHITKLQMTGAGTSGAEFRDLQSSSDVFSAVAATDGRAWALGGEQPARVVGLAVTPEFFKVFGVELALRDLNSVVISDALWTARFGRDPSLVGKKILFDGRPYDVAGIAPADFRFPGNAEAWVLLDLADYGFHRNSNAVLSLYARLKDGVSVKQAQRRVDHELLKVARTSEGFELTKLGYGMDVEPLARRVAGDLRLPLLFLWLASAVLLIAACANVAGLLLARAGSRRREMAIRISVGAGRWQLLRQLLTESFLLALLGGAAGLICAAILLAVLKSRAFPYHQLPYQQMMSFAVLNGRLLLYGLGLAVLSSFLFGLVPAVQLLREQHAGAMARPRRKWFQNFYIAGQVSAAMLLLVVMGLLLKSLKAVELLQPGFDARNLTTAELIKPSQNRSAFYERLLTGLRGSPGVESAALAFSIPFGSEIFTSSFDIRSRHRQPSQPVWQAEAFQVSPGYFSTIRIPLRRGRLIQETDTADKPLVCVVDESLAQRFFANGNPIGQEVGMYSGWARIIGVVGSVRDRAAGITSRPAVYYSLAQVPYFPQVDVIVRSSVNAAPLIRKAVAQADPQVPVFDVKTMEERMDASESVRSVTALLVTIFAGISMLLAAVGIHGVAAQVVTERTSEIGIRMALGARAADIFRHYVMQGVWLSAAGIAMGLAAAAGCAGALKGVLFEVQPLDPAVIAMGGSAVLLISGLAVSVPAWRASQIDPQITLRCE